MQEEEEWNSYDELHLREGSLDDEHFPIEIPVGEEKGVKHFKN